AEEAIARTALGSALVNLGEVDVGLAELETAARLATQADDVTVALRAIHNRSDVLLATGRLDEAAAVALGGLAEARRPGRPRFYGPFLAGNATDALFASGRWDQAEQVSRQGLEVAASDATLIPLLPVRATLEMGLGDLDAARARLQTLRRLLPARIAEAQKAGPLFAGLAELALWRGDLDQAWQLVAEAVPLVEANPRYAAPVYALGLRIEADRAELARAHRPGERVGDDGTATALLQRLSEAATGPAAVGIPELPACHALGLAERTRQAGPSDPAAWAAAAAAWERLGPPHPAPSAHLPAAPAAPPPVGGPPPPRPPRAGGGPPRPAAGAPPRAGGPRLDLGPHAATTVAGAPPPAVQLGLTRRECEVLALVAAGRSNRQI